MKCGFQTYDDVNKTILFESRKAKRAARAQRHLRQRANPIYIYTELATVFQIQNICLDEYSRNIICYGLSERLVNCWGKTSDV